MRKLNANKAAGIDGISPGIIKVLPANWIIFITHLFNLIFTSNYPAKWAFSKCFTIFKKGNKDDPQNYRGISIISSFAKLYDMVLSARFSLWYAPRHEQAGAQKARGCEEQILTLRLLIDIARKTKKTLYVTFIDYQKAYDRVHRTKLLEYLDSKGCGTTFLNAIKHSMKSTGIIGQDTFSTSLGVKQGGSTSCKLFTAYIDRTVDAVNSFGNDNWLENFHILLLMDDTVVFATSRESMQTKLQLLKSEADSIGMLFHRSKCQYLSVNAQDKTPFLLENTTINHTESYTYLGATVSDNNIATQVKHHIEMKKSHARKFVSFLTKNSDAPYAVKRKVWTSAMNSSLLYSCETWLGANVQPAENPYISTLKQMLGVRQTTCNDLVYVETGCTDVKSVILDRQVKFLEKLRNRGPDDYMDLAIKVKSPMGKKIQQLENTRIPHRQEFVLKITARIRESTSTRRLCYLRLNPTLTVSPVLGYLLLLQF